MTKAELEDKVEELEEKVQKLEQDVDYWQKEYDDMEEAKEDLDNQLADLQMKGGINDLSNFIWRLKSDGLWFDKLERFIDEYKRFYND